MIMIREFITWGDTRVVYNGIPIRRRSR
jgi:hypothetical protein